ncbi:phosphoglycerate mutase [Paramecium bursaria Chlorella virus NE-JV-1]|nr:phosphoglycerate mutase [Paramecium bursaria Chlorella virus NE-JV-1]
MTIFLLMRHGEKHDGELSDKGHARAEYLPEYFLKHRPKGVPMPTHLISMKPKYETSSRRCIDTLTPMMRKLGTTLLVEYEREETRELIRYLMNLPQDSVVLVCWEHNYIVNIARELGFPVLNWNDTPISNERDTKRFDVLWMIKDKKLESFLTFAVEDDLTPSVYLHPMRQKYTREKHLYYLFSWWRR